MLPVRTILHPTDFSEPADYAFRVARLIARECGAKIVVLHVAGLHIDLPRPIQTELGIAFDCSGNYETFDAALKAQLREQFESNPGVRVETRLIYGAPAEEILSMADRISCDLIIMGACGRGGLGRLLMGSVAEAVLQRAHCPVLTIKSPDVNWSCRTGDPAHQAVTV